MKVYRINPALGISKTGLSLFSSKIDEENAIIAVSAGNLTTEDGVFVLNSVKSMYIPIIPGIKISFYVMLAKKIAANDVDVFTVFWTGTSRGPARLVDNGFELLAVLGEGVYDTILYNDIFLAEYVYEKERCEMPTLCPVGYVFDIKIFKKNSSGEDIQAVKGNCSDKYVLKINALKWSGSPYENPFEFDLKFSDNRPTLSYAPKNGIDPIMIDIQSNTPTTLEVTLIDKTFGNYSVSHLLKFE